MWGPLVDCTSFAGSAAAALVALLRMNSPQRRIEFPHHIAKWQFERRPAPDQHVIVTGAKRRIGHELHDFPQAAPHAVALHGIADLARHGEPDPDRASLLSGFVTAARLQHEGPAGRFRALGSSLGGSPKVRPAFQALHG